jgi:peptidoglycan/LPS O-acetylase OafA/YrhL
VALTGFLVKRVCRIYIPYIAAVACGIGLRQVIVKPFNPALISWYNVSVWHQSINPRMIVEHVVMVGGVKSQSGLVPVVWSLVHEMRLSLIFPLLMYAVARYSWRVNIGVGLALAAAGFVVRNLGLDPYGMTGFSYSA